ncbi:MAG: hypothetical protein RSD99_14215, partial [Janthinobacterium sp.]
RYFSQIPLIYNTYKQIHFLAVALPRRACHSATIRDVAMKNAARKRQSPDAAGCGAGDAGDFPVVFLFYPNQDR